MKYKAVIFDLFGTLVYVSPHHESEANLKQIASVLSVPFEDLGRLWTETYDGRNIGTFQSYRDCIELICRLLKVPLVDSQIEQATGIRQALLRRETADIRPDAIDALSRLRKKHIKIGLLSNCSLDAVKLWQESPLNSLIDIPVYSSYEGITKPDQRIYRIAAERLGLAPEECIYIADGGVNQELKAAAQAGMHAVLINPYTSDNDNPDQEEWDGPAVSSLTEVLNLLK
jgi:putative hydrolase of the HAD superfamily